MLSISPEKPAHETLEINNCRLETRENCPACASDNFRKIYENRFNESPIINYLLDFYSQQIMADFKYLEESAYILCECKNCRLIFQRDIPNNIFMKKLYEHWIEPFEHHDQETDFSDYTSNAQEIMQVISYFEKNPSSLCFFDFGMGHGRWALLAKGFECQSYGTELTDGLIEHAKSNGIKVISWDEIPQYSFDFINTEQVFEHISEPLQTLRHLKKSLKDEGILKISVPPANDIDRRLKIMDWESPKYSRNSLNAVAPLEHINCFRRSSILKMAAEAGMQEIFMPIKTQYRYTTDWSGIKKIAKNIFRPIYRNILKQQNYVLLRKMQ
jgi:SAM-dependent methyltransferase